MKSDEIAKALFSIDAKSYNLYSYISNRVELFTEPLKQGREHDDYVYIKSIAQKIAIDFLIYGYEMADKKVYDRMVDEKGYDRIMFTNAQHLIDLELKKNKNQLARESP